jgi:NodT family efflux transporter outer membrane factor (OMF) lipoprotein
MKNFLIMALLASSLLTGCSTVTDKNAIAEIQAPFTQEQKWWLAFNDPMMDQLTTDLLQQNLDLQIALIRVEEARALRRVSRSTLFPDITATGNASRGDTESPKAEGIAQAGFDAAWEVDLFGANRAGLDAASARFEAAQANAWDARRIITADIIRAVVEWRQAQQTLSETKSLLAAQSDQVDLFSSRTNAGLIDATFLERARAQREQTATQIPIAEASAKTAQYQIERLMGREPESLASVIAEFKAPGLNVPAPQDSLDIPLDTIRNRPDIRAAALNIIAAQADLRGAEADLWPKITLSAFFGVQETSSGLEGMTASNPIWSLASAITAPLLNFGRLRGAVDAADARAQRAALEYENAVLLALQEARTALSDYLNGVNAVNQQAIALKHRQETVALAQERFNRGLTDMTDLTTAQAELDQATIALIERKASAAIAYVRLQKALGV